MWRVYSAFNGLINAGRVAKSTDPDQRMHSVASDLSLCCLLNCWFEVEQPCQQYFSYVKPPSKERVKKNGIHEKEGPNPTLA